MQYLLCAKIDVLRIVKSWIKRKEKNEKIEVIQRRRKKLFAVQVTCQV